MLRHPVVEERAGARVDKYPMALLFQQNLSKYVVDVYSNDACLFVQQQTTTFIIYLQCIVGNEHFNYCRSKSFILFNIHIKRAIYMLCRVPPLI